MLKPYTIVSYISIHSSFYNNAAKKVSVITCRICPGRILHGHKLVSNYNQEATSKTVDMEDDIRKQQYSVT